MCVRSRSVWMVAVFSLMLIICGTDSHGAEANRLWKQVTSKLYEYVHAPKAEGLYRKFIVSALASILVCTSYPCIAQQDNDILQQDKVDVQQLDSDAHLSSSGAPSVLAHKTMEMSASRKECI